MSIDAPESMQVAAPRKRSRLGGRQKAAVLLVSLGPDRAAEIFGHLNEDEIEALSLDMAKLSQVPVEVSQDVIGELVETCLAQAYMAEGGVEYAREVLERAVGPERARQIVGRLSAAIERRPFEFLRRTPPEQIHAFIRNEAPQTVALVIANLHTDLAAQVLALLEPEEQAQVAMRVGTMRETSPEVIDAVESVLRQRLSNVVSQDYAVAGGVQSLADILNHTDRGTERNVLDSLALVDADLAEQVRMLLFTFEDIVKLDDRSIQLILKEVESKDLAVALRGVGRDVQERIFSNMSERGGEMLAEEMEYMPAQRRAVVEEAQGRIVAVVRRLEEAGGIVIGRGGDEDML
ncbi:MAG: flagellar motor switch protein FliG [Solirubrobacteraceae bacterium]|jgi:flagellar motor switch protein FliG|nr:flagellar motor switch protein FliG [Solirubrobacteraceae bacterium]